MYYSGHFCYETIAIGVGTILWLGEQKLVENNQDNQI